MRKKGIIIGIIVIIIALIGSISYKTYTNKIQGIGTPLEPIHKLVRIQYFDQGTYTEYKALFTDPKSVLIESQFESYRKNHKTNDFFKYGSDSINGVIKHMKVEKENDNLYKVYYLKNINDEEEKKTANYWIVAKKNGKWLLKNGI
ncbi:hypothetical protein ACSVC9_00755 [Clostridium sp. LBM24168]